MSKHTFDIMVAFAGIQTKEGQPFIDCIKKIRDSVTYHGFYIIFENGMSLIGRYTSSFTLNPYRCPSYHNSNTYNGITIATIGTSEYWQQFREAVKEVAKTYEF